MRELAKELRARLRVYWGLALALCETFLYAAWGAVVLLMLLAYFWVRGHKGCPGPTGWSPGLRSDCVWCNHDMRDE